MMFQTKEEFENRIELDAIDVIAVKKPWNWEYLCLCRENLGYKNGQLLAGFNGSSPLLVDAHRDNDKYVRVYVLDYVTAIESNIPLTLHDFEESVIEIPNRRATYKYLRGRW